MRLRDDGFCTAKFALGSCSFCQFYLAFDKVCWYEKFIRKLDYGRMD